MSKYEETEEELYRAIGRFMFEFSQVEFTIRHFLAEELKVDEKHFSAVIESYDVSLLCRVAIKVFCTSSEKEKAEAIKRFIDKFQKINDERNRIAHGLWMPADGGSLHHVSRNKLEANTRINQIDELEELADQASRLHSDLAETFLT